MQDVFKTANFAPVHNMAEALGGDRANMLGAWVINDNTIYIAENVGYKGTLSVNNDLPHVFRHELGHMLNDRLGELSGTVASDLVDFRNAFKVDLEANNPSLSQALKTFADTCNTSYDQRHEVFADMFAHATGTGSVNGYSLMLKNAFPNSFNYVVKFVKENGL